MLVCTFAKINSPHPGLTRKNIQPKYKIRSVFINTGQINKLRTNKPIEASLIFTAEYMCIELYTRLALKIIYWNKNRNYNQLKMIRKWYKNTWLQQSKATVGTCFRLSVKLLYEIWIEKNVTQSNWNLFYYFFLWQSYFPFQVSIKNIYIGINFTKKVNHQEQCTPNSQISSLQKKKPNSQRQEKQLRKGKAHPETSPGAQGRFNNV